ncbi:CRISPR-associated endonuclease Cas2 [Actinoalloteichus caeruleus]|uniref:CRISPR-associated endoribonuclease Cas2 n=1 Tax=Actinoalloteichus caeruleus DSM 43889 TaxID=1120930 RepID=A0ABT1JCB9_ACTCY|nr:CRISPR-associated endonuclease Cas2 [Actinoalloteichus caeruleus]MCP2330143.1 CRISPR-associated protein Cas2 [Actinoalloteichus caeruleus DSM 43889]
MELLISYDVETATRDGQRRLRRVAKICEAYGHRVQKSVFEVVCRPQDWVLMKHRLAEVINSERDSIRVYHLDRGSFSRAEHMGASRLAPHESPLVY